MSLHITPQFKYTVFHIFICIIADSPSKPQDVTVQPTCDALILSWTPPTTDGGFPITDYFITYRTKKIHVSPERNKLVIDNLDHNTEYTIQIRAVTEAAKSDDAVVKGKTTQFCKLYLVC